MLCVSAHIRDVAAVAVAREVYSREVKMALGRTNTTLQDHHGQQTTCRTCTDRDRAGRWI